jgi:Transcriptional regulators containing a DNA-binding HTH domain and an aminotransferase domain (MocR family) and their eukaryotic orthologs
MDKLMTQPVIKFTRGVPPPESFPTQEISDCAVSLLNRDPDIVLQYGTSGGYQPLRHYLAKQAGVTENRIAIGEGSLQLSDIVARILLKPGSLVYVESPSYDRSINIFRRTGARVVGIPLEEDGCDLAKVTTRLASGERPVLFYIIPDFQNPSGTVLSMEKRKALVDLAEQYGFWIIEDSPYRRLRYHGIEHPSMFELAPGRVVRMSSFSKLISPGLRVGYSILPDPLAPDFLRFAEDTYINSSYFTQGIVYEYIRLGLLEPNIAKLKALYQPRLDCMLSSLSHEMGDLAEWHKPEGGFFVGMTLQGEFDTDELLARASHAGLLLSDGRGFFPEKNRQCFIRLPFCALTPDEIQSGITRLAQLIRSMLDK